MLDHNAHYHSIVKDEVATQIKAFFMPKDDVGFAVSFGFAPHPDMGMAPAWIIAVSIKSHLLGKGPVGQGAPVYGLLPEDRQIREAVKFVVEKTSSDWHDEIEAPISLGDIK